MVKNSITPFSHLYLRFTTIQYFFSQGDRSQQLQEFLGLYEILYTQYIRGEELALNQFELHYLPGATEGNIYLE